MSRNRTEVEECRILDINVLKNVCKTGSNSGAYRWLIDGEVEAKIGYYIYMHDDRSGILNLNYIITSTQNTHSQSIKIISSKCNYGGFRYWRECPYCGKRVRKLYLPSDDEIFACRYCLYLTYESKSKNYHNRVSREFNALFDYMELSDKTKRFYYNGKLTRNAKEQFSERQRALEELRKGYHYNREDIRNQLELFFESCFQIENLFKNGTPEEKSQLVYAISENLTLDDGKLGWNFKEPWSHMISVDISDENFEWGSIVDLFRTRIIDTELRSLVDSIKLIFEKFDIELAI